MLKKLMFLRFIILMFAAVVFLSQCSGSNNRTEITSYGAGNGEMPSLPDEAKIEVIDPNYEIKEKNLGTLQSLPLPEIKFIFDSTNMSATELPENIKILLNDHWKEAMKYFYEQSFNKPKNAQESSDRMRAWSIYCRNTDKRLRESVIAAPNGQRKISQKESMEIWGGLNKSAINVTDKLKTL